MAITTINWGDGTTDKITVDFPGTGGKGTATIASDPNYSKFDRTKTITFITSKGATKTVKIIQKAMSRAYSAAYPKNYKIL